MTRTITLRGPADLPAIVPTLLGFAPTNSMVMLTFGATRAFHARIDLGPLPAMVEALLPPALRHGVQQVVLASYGGTLQQVQALASEFEKVGITVAEACTIRVVGTVAQVNTSAGEWFAVVDPDTGTRKDLIEDLQPQGDQPAPDELGIEDLDMENATVRTAQLSEQLRDTRPGDDAGRVANALALAAWLAGDGARSWIAVDIARKHADAPGFAELVAQFLEQAIPPEEWSRIRSGLNDAAWTL